MEDIAALYIEAIREVQPSGPYYLGGHSFGSYVAYEMGQQLQRQGEDVALVAVLDTRIPMDYQSYYEQLASNDTYWIMAVADTFATFFAKELTLSRRQLVRLSWEHQLEHLRAWFIESGMMPPGTDIKAIRGLVNLFKTQAHISYVPKAPLPMPVVLFRAQDEAVGMDIPEFLRTEDVWDWRPFANGPVPVERVPGNHLTMMIQPHAEVLADRLWKHLVK